MPQDEICEKCGKPATVTYYETCCTGTIFDIECGCNGHSIPVHLCARCEVDYLADLKMIADGEKF